MEHKHKLETVEWGVIPIYNYNGTLVEKLVGGYRVFGKTCIKPSEVDDIIQESCSILSESIVTTQTIKNNGSIECTNLK